MKHFLHFKVSRMLAAMAVFIILPGMGWGQTNPPVQSIPYTQNFGISTFTTMPTGWASWNGLSGAGITTQALAEASVPTGNATITAATTAQTTGATYGYATSSNARPYIQTSSNTSNGVNQLAFALNTTGVSSIVLSYDVEIISAQPRTVGIVMQYRIGHTGSWTTVSGSGNPYSQAGGTTGVKVSPSLSMPSAINNQSEVQIRWAIWRGTESGNSSGIAIDNISVTGSISSPSISVGTVTPFGNQNVNTTSPEKFYSVSGLNLTSDIVITPPPGFEISSTSGTGFISNPNTITLLQSGGSVSPTTIYVRFSPTLSQVYSGNISHASTGAVLQNVAVTGTGVANFYSASTGNLELVTSWGTNTDGTGTNPADFITNFQVFNIQNTPSPALGGNWTVSGTSSKVILGNGTNPVNFTIPSSFSLTGTIDLSANSTLTIQNTTLPTFGTISSASIVDYDGASGIQNIFPTTYGNLTLSSAGTKTFTGSSITTISGNLLLNNTILDGPSASPFATLSLGGNLTYQGTVTPPIDGNSITLITTGTGTQTISGNGNTARWFRLQTTNAGNNIILSETGGLTNLLLVLSFCRTNIKTDNFGSNIRSIQRPVSFLENLFHQLVWSEVHFEI